MARWEPDAQGRLQQAAVALFLERGYAEVTVAEIAARAGLTKRTFFNHFADKRDVLFVGAPALEASVVRHLGEADEDLARWSRDSGPDQRGPSSWRTTPGSPGSGRTSSPRPPSCKNAT